MERWRNYGRDNEGFAEKIDQTSKAFPRKKPQAKNTDTTDYGEESGIQEVNTSFLVVAIALASIG
jgi:hypothetical protein